MSSAHLHTEDLVLAPVGLWTAPARAKGQGNALVTKHAEEHHATPGPNTASGSGRDFGSHQIPSSSSSPPPSPTSPPVAGSDATFDDPDAEADLASDNIQTLWTTRWKRACLLRRHPFQDAHYLDFAPVFASLAAAREPATYARALLDQAGTLAAEADDAAAARQAETASRLLLRACALLRVGTSWPSPLDPETRTEARDLQRRCHRRAVGLLPSARDSPLEEVLIPHLTGDVATASRPHLHEEREEEGKKKTASPAAKKTPRHIALTVRVPPRTLSTGAPCPAVVIPSRDRTGETRACEEVLAREWGAVVVEIPPGDDDDDDDDDDNDDNDEGPEEDDNGRRRRSRWWSSVLAWMAAVGIYDMGRVVVLGGGRAALRAAEACGAGVKGVVAYLGEGRRAPAGCVILDGPGEAGRGASVSCQVLVVRAASGTVESNGLWTPPLPPAAAGEGGRHGDGDGDDNEYGGAGLMTLSAYGTAGGGGDGSRSCCEITTATTSSERARAFDWMGDVMEGREHHHHFSPAPAPVPTTFARVADQKRSQRPLPEWFSREGTPPESDVDMGSVCGSSL